MAHPAQRAVQRLEVEAIGRVGHGVAHQRVNLGTPPQGLVARREVLPRGGGALGVGDEQLVVVRPADLLGYQGEQVPPELQRLRAGHQRLNGGFVEEVWQRRQWGPKAVVELRAVRHTAP